MSTETVIEKIAIVHNLPKGGGLRVLTEIINRYKYKYDIDIYVISPVIPYNIPKTKLHWIRVFPWRGVILNTIWIVFILPLIHLKVSKSINWKKYKCVIFTHDYFTKSPYLLKYINNSNKCYICNESQREYYEPLSIHASSIFEKISIILRYPIKLIDISNTKHSSKLFCNSKYSKQVLSKIYKRKFEILYPGVNEKYFIPGRAIKENLIICIGGINKIKNQIFLVKSLTPILNKYKLVLIGNGKNKYINKILDINKNIKIISNISDYKLRQYYQKAKLTCITSYREPFGLSSIESQACGTPVVAIDDGGTSETLENRKTGYVSRRNENEFLLKSIKAIENVYKMGKLGREYVLKKWTHNLTMKPFDDYIRSL